MKLLRGLAQYYVDLLMKLGLVRFSLLLASGLVVLAMVVQIAVTMLLQGKYRALTGALCLLRPADHAVGGLFYVCGG